MMASARLAVLLGAAVTAVGAAGLALERIAFASCARQGQAQPVWDAVLARDPDLFILAGDNVYADTTDERALRSILGAVPARNCGP